jgi:protein-disulfide isomerase
MAREKSRAKEVEMEEWLFANQTTFTPDSVQAAAQKILGISDFATQYTAKLADIRKDVADGAALGINSTPTLFINGVRVERQLMPAHYFELAIQLELNKAAGK